MEGPKCKKCGGAGWLWWYELDNYDGPATATGTDDTRYSCDDKAHAQRVIEMFVSDWEQHKRAMREHGLPPLGRRCEHCMGVGYTKATLDMHPAVMRTLAKHHPNEPVENSIKKEKCHYCDGTGMFGEGGPNVHEQYSR